MRTSQRPSNGADFCDANAALKAALLACDRQTCRWLGSMPRYMGGSDRRPWGSALATLIAALRERQQDKLQPHETHLFATEPEKKAPNKVAWCFAHGPPRIFQ